MKLRLVETEEDIRRCFPAILELRPHLQEDEIIPLLNRIFSENGHLLMVEAEGTVPAIAVFRINHYLIHRKDLYVDDLSTLPSYRRKGYGRALLDWMKNYALKEQCNTMHLDSGHERHEAHRLYLNFGFYMSAHHFTMHLKS